MNYTECILMIPRCLISIIVLFLITKLIGKKQVSELSLFDYIIGISIGNFTAEMTMNFNNQYINGVIAIITFGIVSFIINYLNLKSISLRRLIEGVPTILIDNGQVLEKELKRCKIDINSLLEQARNSGYFDLNEISYAVMETNGKISFLLKDQNKPATKKDMKIKLIPDTLPVNIIIDSNLMINNIKNTDHDLSWFKKQLKIKGYDTYENIILCTYQNNEIIIYKKTNTLSKKVLE